MKLSEKQQIFTRNIGKLIKYAHLMGFGLTFGHAFRSDEEQLRLYEQGLSKTLNSQHLNALRWISMSLSMAGFALIGER